MIGGIDVDRMVAEYYDGNYWIASAALTDAARGVTTDVFRGRSIITGKPFTPDDNARMVTNAQTFLEIADYCAAEGRRLGQVETV